MKTKEELKELKEEYTTVCKQLHELTEEELAQVSGGGIEPGIEPTSPETPGINGAPSLKPNEFGPTYYK